MNMTLMGKLAFSSESLAKMLHLSNGVRIMDVWKDPNTLTFYVSVQGIGCEHIEGQELLRIDMGICI